MTATGEGHDHHGHMNAGIRARTHREGSKLRPLSALLVVAASLAALVVISGPVTARATITQCTKTYCPYVGESPVSTGCANGAYAVDNYRILFNSGGDTGVVHLMYSPACNTNWTEADTYNLPTDITVWNTIGQQQNTDNLTNYGSYGYTHMVNGAYDAGSCIENDRFFLCIGQPAITSYPPYMSF